ncbi:hypothetical protein, partial [Methylotenera sp.]|uniref:hypothetical protein n=1 Tax=Methylotenera sp. TaxID=2051956 RepID=UPI002731C13B
MYNYTTLTTCPNKRLSSYLGSTSRWAANPTQLDTLRIGGKKDIGMKFKKASMAVYIAIVSITVAGCATTG